MQSITLDTKYVYSANRVHTLMAQLLSPIQVERLVAASDVAELLRILQETYLAGYVSNSFAENWHQALTKSIEDAKKTIEQIAPEPILLQCMWFRYDIHNLRTFVKSRKADLDYEEIMRRMARMGVYMPETLYSHAVNDTLYQLESPLNTGFHRALNAVEGGSVARADIHLDQAYFGLLHQCKNRANHQFVNRYVYTVIDLYNVVNRLRTALVDRIDFSALFISGGTLSYQEVATVELAKQQLIDNFGGVQIWQPAFDEYDQGNMSQVTTQAEEAVTRRVREMSGAPFSVASLARYFLEVRANAQVVQTIMIAKRAKVSVPVLRTMLRSVYGYAH